MVEGYTFNISNKQNNGNRGKMTLQLIDQVKARNLAAMKSKDEKTKNLMRVILGQLQQNNDTSDKGVISVCQKLVKGNNEVISQLEKESSLSSDWQERLDDARAENKLLEELLPKAWSEQEVRNLIKEQQIDVVGAANDGAAMGLVTKALKEASKSPFDGRMVKGIVSQLRSPSK